MKQIVKNLSTVIIDIFSTLNISVSLAIGPLHIDFPIVRSALVFFLILFIIKELNLISSDTHMI